MSQAGGGAPRAVPQLIRLIQKLPYSDLQLTDKSGRNAILNDTEFSLGLVLPYGLGPTEPRVFAVDENGALALAVFNGTVFTRLLGAQAFDAGATGGVLAAAGVRLAELFGGGTVSLADKSLSAARGVSGVNAAQALTFEVRNLAKTMAIHSAASAGTANLTVEVSADNGANWLVIDTLAAALLQVKQYTEATVGAGIALSPLAFRFIRITAGAAGVGNTTTLTVGIK